MLYDRKRGWKEIPPKFTHNVHVWPHEEHVSRDL